MGKTTEIAWCHSTFNPWVGCTKVSPGCAHCYAEAYDRRVGGVPVSQRDPSGDGGAELRWGVGARRTRTSVSYWKQPLAWNAAALKAGDRHRVFCASLADVFDKEVPDVWRIELFDLIRRTPQLDWLLLTKRPESIRSLITYAIDAFVRAPDATMETVEMLEAWSEGRPPANIWLGTTVEDQQRAAERIPALLEVPAAVHFLSCEPLLERLDLSAFMSGPYVGIPGDVVHPNYNAGIDWVIVGGESGPGARPFNLGWAIDLVNQCRSGGASPFVKQLGTRPVDAVDAPIRLIDRHGGNWTEWPEALRLREYPEARP